MTWALSGFWKCLTRTVHFCGNHKRRSGLGSGRDTLSVGRIADKLRKILRQVSVIGTARSGRNALRVHLTYSTI